MSQCEEHLLDVEINELPVFRDVTAHDIFRTWCIVCTVIANLFAFLQIFRHATNYTDPIAQRYIIRILFMVPVYTIVATLSVEFYQQHVYLGAIYEFYESLVVISFFFLLWQYLHKDLGAVRRIFNLLEPMNWIWPIRIWHMCFGCTRKGKTVDGLKWFNIVWFGVLQFCLVKFLGALAKCITEALDYYCAESNSFTHASVWIQLVEILALVTAMMFLIQFYQQTKKTLAAERPLLKFLAIKLVVVLFYLQTFIIARLTAEDGPLQPTRYLSYPSLAIGIPNALICFEMIIVAVIDFYAFPIQPYRASAVPFKTAAAMDSPSELERMNPSREARLDDNNFNNNINNEDGDETLPAYDGLRRGLGVGRRGTGYDNLAQSEPSGPAPPSHSAIRPHQGGAFGWMAIVDAINIWDVAQSIGTGFYWIFNVKITREEQARFDRQFEQRHQMARTQSLGKAVSAI